MVPTDVHVRYVYLRTNSVMMALQELDASQGPETLCMHQSTVEQRVSKNVARAIPQTGADMLDAPVSGGKHAHQLHKH